MDKGHEALVRDLENLLHVAKQKKFHDFETRDATPKANLIYLLQQFIERTVAGVYDN